MKILLIVPHMSTGGMPQVALKRVEHLTKEHDVYVIEYRQIAWSYVVQREKMIELLKDKFISLGNVWGDDDSKRDKFIDIVNQINPDIIHLEEIPEMFIFGIKKEHADWLYRKDRKYKIIETTHTSTFNINNKIYLPDKFIFVSKYSENQYKKFNIPISVVEYPVERVQINKSEAIKKLGLNPDYFHVLNVGLFNRDKNQGYLFEIAKKLKNYKIHFHFVGNLAENFSDYWKPLLENMDTNCFIYGERDDVDVFYQAADILIHPSILELNPLAIKEATSYKLPVYLNYLESYMDMYENYKNIKYLTMNVNDDADQILKSYNIIEESNNVTFSQILVEEYENIIEHKLIEEAKIESLTSNNSSYYDYYINFGDGAKVHIMGENIIDFDVEFLDKNTNSEILKIKIPTNHWCCTYVKYYKEYKINILHNDKIIVSHEFDLKNKEVLIQLDSKSIGDTIAWFPYVEEFRKKHQCVVYCSTFWNSWFEKEYPEIRFVEPSNIDIQNLYAKYNIGWYTPLDFTRNPYDYKNAPLQKTASDILGLEFNEIVPKITIPEGVRPIEDKYVCIAQFSTANSKHWHYPTRNSNKGWQIVVDWLNEQGYKVMVISKQKTNLKNVIDMTGDFPIEHRINQLKHSEFFIGIGSGLSWLAWAVGKKVVMISGFSNPICEFKSNIINVHNYNVCNGCFNKYEFDRGDWDWCPEHKNTNRHFECSTNITPQMVIDRMITSQLVQKIKDVDFTIYDSKIILDKNDIVIDYIKIENKLTFTYKNPIKTPPINVDIRNYYSNTLIYSLSEISLSNEYVLWCMPGSKLFEQTDKLRLVFYENEEILQIEHEL